MNLARRSASQLLRPQRRFASNGAPFEGAGVGHRGAGWVTTRLGLNTLLFSNGEILLSRARDAIRNTPYGSAAIDSYVANAIGRGIRMVPMHPEPAVRTKITEAWNRWTKECDVEYEPRNPASGQSDFYGLQTVASREEFEAGEVFVRFRRRPSSDKLTVPLQLELMEAEQLPLWRNSPAVLMDEKNVLRMGIEYRPDGRRQAYHFFKAHPYETMFYPLDGLSVEAIPANEILHVYRPLRAGQMRGQPRMASVLATLHEIDGYQDAEIVRKKTAAMITGFITKNSPGDQLLPENVTGTNGQIPHPTDPLATISKLEPGTMNVLFPGEDVKFAQPTQDGQFEQVILIGLRAFAAGAGITYEQLGDLSKLNYSSIRAGLLEFRRKIEQYQRHVFIFQFCQPIYRTWLREAAICGALRLPRLLTDPTEYEDVRWETPGWPWVDPQKDIDASRDAIRAGLSTRTIELAGRGYDSADVDAEIAADRDRADALGNVYDSDPTKVLIGRETNPTEAPPAQREKGEEDDDAQ